jgi:hypothetical protein
MMCELSIISIFDVTILFTSIVKYDVTNLGT